VDIQTIIEALSEDGAGQKPMTHREQVDACKAAVEEVFLQEANKFSIGDAVRLKRLEGDTSRFSGQPLVFSGYIEPPVDPLSNIYEIKDVTSDLSARLPADCRICAIATDGKVRMYLSASAYLTPYSDDEIAAQDAEDLIRRAEAEKQEKQTTDA
jgi:hypothetical protein